MRKLFYLIAASLLVFSCKTGSVKIGTSQGDLLEKSLSSPRKLQLLLLRRLRTLRP